MENLKPLMDIWVGIFRIGIPVIALTMLVVGIVKKDKQIAVISLLTFVIIMLINLRSIMEILGIKQ